MKIAICPGRGLKDGGVCTTGSCPRIKKITVRLDWQQCKCNQKFSFKQYEYIDNCFINKYLRILNKV